MNLDEMITVGKLKKMLEQFPDETLVRIESHYIGYGINATVFKRLSTKNVRGFIEPNNSRSLAFCSDHIVKQIEAGENPRLITQEQEDAAPFEMKSVMI